MRLDYALSAYERARGDMPFLPVVNMFAEAAPSEDTGVTLQSRPGLEDVASLVSSPVEGQVDAVFQKDGVLDGARFVVCGGYLYENEVQVGAIDGDGPFSIDGYENFLFVAGGGSLWGYDGSTLSAVTFPDGANITKVLVGSSRAICIRADTETFYWSDPLTSTIGALSFASAESQPDKLRDALYLDDTLILFGAETVEFWPNTSDADLPFQPLEGRVYEAGIKQAGAAVSIGSTFAWVTADNRVCMGDADTILSNEGLEAKIKASASCKLWSFWIDATEFLALTLDAQTYVMSGRTRYWSEFQSYGESNFLPHCYAGGVFGTTDGRLIQFSDDHLDLGNVLERRFRAGAPINAGIVPVDNLGLRSNPGNTPYLDGEYANPVVEARFSRDGGKTWGDWQSASLGAQGEYFEHVQWLACGMYGRPGIMVEFRVTDPVPFRVSDVYMNESYGAF